VSISSKIESLITAANSVTGESRTDLTSAVQDLKDGYGQGGETQYWKRNATETARVITPRGNIIAPNIPRGMFHPLDTSGNGISTRQNLYSEFIQIVKFKISQTSSVNATLLGWTASSTYGVLNEIKLQNGRIFSRLPENGSVTLNEWYYVCSRANYSVGKISRELYNKDGILDSEFQTPNLVSGNSSSVLYFGGCYQSGNEEFLNGMIDPDGCIIKGDNTILYGVPDSITQAILDRNVFTT